MTATPPTGGAETGGSVPGGLVPDGAETGGSVPGGAETGGADPAEGERLAGLAAEVLRRPARLGGTRLVCVDGSSSAGKTVFAGRLAAVFPEWVPIVHTDDLLAGWDDQLTFWPRLEDAVLAPLRCGRAGHYHAYNWMAGRFDGPEIEVPPAPVVILEGMSAARAVVRAEATLTVFMDTPAELRLARSAVRDGAAMRPHLETWRAREDRHFAADRTAASADLVIRTDRSGRQNWRPSRLCEKGGASAVDGPAGLRHDRSSSRKSLQDETPGAGPGATAPRSVAGPRTVIRAGGDDDR